MSDVGNLNEQAARLVRQIGLIRTGSGIDEINKNVGAIELEIRELRRDNHRLARENEEFKGSLKSLISSIENTRLLDLPDNYQGVSASTSRRCKEETRAPAKSTSSGPSRQIMIHPE